MNENFVETLKKIIDKNDAFCFGNSEDFSKVLKSIEENTSFTEVPANELEIIGLDMPIMAEAYKMKYALSEAAYEAKNAEERASSFIVKIGDNYYPFRDYAISSLLARARINGSALSKISIADFATILNTCLKTNPEVSQVVKVGNKVNCFLSNDYKRIPLLDVFSAAQQKAASLGGVFSSGFCSLDIASCEWKMPNNIISSYKKACSNGLSWDVVPVLKVATSNTGASGANIYPMFRRGNKTSFIIGKPLRLEHKGNSDIEMFKENLNNIYAIFESSIKNIELLKNKKIVYPANCFKNICKTLGVQKKYTSLACEDFELLIDGLPFVTAFDVYMGLTEIIFHTKNDSKNDLAVLSAQETIARALNLEWNEMDCPVLI